MGWNRGKLGRPHDGNGTVNVAESKRQLVKVQPTGRTDHARSMANHEMGRGSHAWKGADDVTLDTFLRKAEALRARMEEEERCGGERALASLDALRSNECVDGDTCVLKSALLSDDTNHAEYISLRLEVEGLDLCAPDLSKEVHVHAKNFSYSECRPQDIRFTRTAPSTFQALFEVCKSGWAKFEENQQALLLELWMPAWQDTEHPTLLGILRLALNQRTQRQNGWWNSEMTELWDPLLGLSRGPLKVFCSSTMPYPNSAQTTNRHVRDSIAKPEHAVLNAYPAQDAVEIEVVQINDLPALNDAVAWSIGYLVGGMQEPLFQEAVPHVLPLRPGFKIRFHLSAKGIFTQREQDAVQGLHLALVCHTAKGTALSAGTCNFDVVAFLDGRPNDRTQHTCLLQLRSTGDNRSSNARGTSPGGPTLQVCLRRDRRERAGSDMPEKAHPIASGTLVLRVLRLGKLQRPVFPSPDPASHSGYWRIGIELCPIGLIQEDLTEASIKVGEHCKSIGFRQDLHLSLSEDQLCHFANGHIRVKLYWHCNESDEANATGQTCISTLPTLVSPHGILGWHPFTTTSGEREQICGMVELQARFVSFNGHPLSKSGSPLQLFPGYRSLLPVHAMLGPHPETLPNASATALVTFRNLFVPAGLQGRGRISLLYKFPGQDKFLREHVEVTTPMPAHMFELHRSCMHLYESVSASLRAAAEDLMIVEIWFSSISHSPHTTSQLGTLIGAVRFDAWMALSSILSSPSEDDKMYKLTLVTPFAEGVEAPTLEASMALICSSDTATECSHIQESSKSLLAADRNVHCAELAEQYESAVHHGVRLNLHQVSNLSDNLVGRLLYIQARGPCLAVSAQTRIVRATQEGKAAFCFRKVLHCNLPKQNEHASALDLVLMLRQSSNDCPSFLLEADPLPSDAEVGRVALPLPGMGCIGKGVQSMYDEEGQLVAHLHATLAVESVNQEEV